VGAEGAGGAMGAEAVGGAAGAGRPGGGPGLGRAPAVAGAAGAGRPGSAPGAGRAAGAGRRGGVPGAGGAPAAARAGGADIPRAEPRDPAVPSPFHWQDGHLAVSLDGGHALFSTRRGGCSEGPYATLNLGATAPGPGDEAARVARNRAVLARLVGRPAADFAHGRQVHGKAVQRVRERPQGGWGHGRPMPAAESDGQATALAGVPLVVVTADCLPIALVAPGAVAMLHAGWRGLAAGVLEEGLAAVAELGDGERAGARIHAIVGPGARGCCYEVGEEVHEAFIRRGGTIRDGRRIDLAAIAARELAARGVEVHDCGLCTMCAPELFFSHRREHGVTGRQGGVAWRS
jgi:polyphenol oxidase